MHTLDIRRDPAGVEYTAMWELSDAADRFRDTYPHLAEPLVLPWSYDPVLVLDGDRPWLYSPAERDPAAVDGRTVLPRSQAKRLADHAELGMHFDAMAVAHELDPDGPVAELLPVLTHGPRRCTDDVARAVVGPVPPHPALASTARLAAWILHRTGTAVAAAHNLALDPIVFGVVGRAGMPGHGEPALFVPLAAWRW